MTKIGRNEPCPCGSGKKYKRCCLDHLPSSPQHHGPSFVCEPTDPIAASLPPIRGLADIRPYLDAVVHQHKLLEVPRDEALVHVLRATQLLDMSGFVLAALAQDYHGFYDPIRKLQDALRYLIYKVHTRCPEGGDGSTLTSPHQLEMAGDAIGCFQVVSDIHDGVASTEAGFLHCDVGVEEPRVRFAYADDRVETHQRARLLSQHDIAATAVRAKAEESPGDAFRTALNSLVQSTVVSNDGQRCTYSAPAGTLEAFLAEMALTEGVECQLPEAWSAGPYTVGDHRRVWRLLRAMSAMHTAVLMNLVSQRGEAPPPIGSELRLNREWIVDRCSRLLGVAPEASREILRDLTYDPTVPWTDVMFQPLVALGTGELLTCRVAIEGNHFERNLLALLPRLKYRREGEQSLKREREQIMIGELEAAAQTVGLAAQHRVTLRAEQKVLTDVDLLLWDPTASHAFAVSLKWFYGPDSLQEVRNHDGWYTEAIRVARDSATFIASHAAGLSSQYNLTPALSSTTEVHPIVVSRVDLPSELVDTAGCPVVTQAYFTSVLKESGGDLSTVLANLPEPLPAVRAAEDVRRTEVEVAFGAHRFLLPGVEATWVGP